MRKQLAAGALALCVLLSAGPAMAGGVDVGAEAPSFGAGAFINTEAVSIEDLAGRLILLELFSTT